MKILRLACAAALLAGCASRSPVLPTVATSTAPHLPGPPRPGAFVRCEQLDPSVAAEADVQTPLTPIIAGGTSALSAALMASEVRKNAALRKVIEKYRSCRMVPQWTALASR